MRVAVFIDGGHMRVLSREAGHKYDPGYIEKIALAAVNGDETLLRILYYDCAPFNGTAEKPVSGKIHQFPGDDKWLKTLARKDFFAVRLGVLKFRGYKLKQIPMAAAPTDDDFTPDFEQKGVDMRIGLDIASYSANRIVDRIILLSNDTDCIPAMKHGRKAGLQIVLAAFPNSRGAPELLEHCDYKRAVAWPE